MNPFSNTKKILMIVCASVLILMVAYGFLFREIQRKNESISMLDDQIDIASLEETRLQSIKALIADASTDIEKLNSYFIAPEGLVDFIESIELLGASAGVTVSINSVGPSHTAPVSPGKEFIRFKMEINGSWNSVFHFLNMIEHMPYKIQILRTDFDASPDSWKGFIEFDVLKLNNDVPESNNDAVKINKDEI